MAVSLKDVAQVAGVSIKTVSNVVHDYPFVSAVTRARVQEALAEMGYQPNLSARGLRSGQSGLIALSVPEVAVPYFGELADRVVVAAEARGLTVLIDQTGGQRGHERRVAAGIRHNLVDGTIASPLAMTAEDIQSLGRRPLVLLGERLSHVAADHVAIDNVAAACSATAHLLSEGRHAIGAVGTSEEPLTGTGEQRLRGYHDALVAAGVPIDVHLEASVGWYHRADGYAATRALLIRRPDLDALFCFNDLLAIGALRALREAGRLVPDDVAVVGFDDIEECLYTAPALSSVSPDKEAIAQTAIDLLIQRMGATTAMEPQEVFPPYRLAVRASSTTTASRSRTRRGYR
ncbi:MAG: LacI family DNA-binding transcriptional regulator [Pseudonocardiales bacterium]